MSVPTQLDHIEERLSVIETRLTAIETALANQPQPPAPDLSLVQARLDDVMAAVLNVQVLLEA